MSKRLELNLNMSFFKEDWAFKIDFSKCKNFEDLFKYLDNVIIEDINVGEQFRKMYTFPENCPLLDTFIPFRGFTTNPENEIGIDGALDHIAQYSSKHSEAIVSEKDTNHPALKDVIPMEM
jgi:hypothetical protein